LRILDIGAHHGEFLNIFSNLKFDNISQNFEIFCFEPFNKNFNIIKNKLNFLNKNIKAKIYNFAISDKTEKKIFYIGKSDTLVTCESNWLKKFKKDFSSYKKLSMQCLTFCDFVKKFDFDITKDIDLLKIDVEGHDFIVLINVLENNLKIKSVMIEFEIDYIFKTTSIIKYLISKKFSKIFIFGRSGIYTSYIGEYINLNHFLKVIKKNKILAGNLVAFK
jgi:FkbM family methyltransferase